jgi:hypothetical protein
MQTYRVASGSALAAYSPFKAESAPQNGDRFAPETALGRTIAPATLRYSDSPTNEPIATNPLLANTRCGRGRNTPALRRTHYSARAWPRLSPPFRSETLKRLDQSFPDVASVRCGRSLPRLPAPCRVRRRTLWRPRDRRRRSERCPSAEASWRRSIGSVVRPEATEDDRDEATVRI